MEAAENRASRLAPDERRAQVLDAARRVLIRDGFADASTASVAREAGVTRPLVHHYFGSRRALFLAVVEGLAERLPGAIRTDLQGLPLEEIVELNGNAILDAVEQDREAWVALFSTAGADPDVDVILDRARDAAIQKMLVNQAPVNADSPELRLVLRIFLGAFEAALAEWTRTGRATRAQLEVILPRTLLAMVTEVLPALAPPDPS